MGIYALVQIVTYSALVEITNYSLHAEKFCIRLSNLWIFMTLPLIMGRGGGGADGIITLLEISLRHHHFVGNLVAAQLMLSEQQNGTG